MTFRKYIAHFACWLATCLFAISAVNVKTVNGVAIANVKTVNGVAKANVKTLNGVDNTGGGGSALLTDLVAYWTMDEASGTRVDSHDDNDLTDVNTVPGATGKINNGVDLEASTTEYLSIADNTDLSIGSNISFTIAFWLNVESSSFQVYVGKYGAGSEYYVYCTGAASSFNFLMSSSGGDKVASSSEVMSIATWYYIVVWHDAAADTVNIQINNGTPGSAATSDATPTDGNGAFTVGQINGSLYTDGIVDEVGFWKRVLTAGERTSLYNSGSGLAYPF